MTDLQVGGTVELEHEVSVFAAEVTGVAGEVARAPGAGAAVRDAEPDELSEVLEALDVPERGAETLGVRAEEAGYRRRLTIPFDGLTPVPGAEEARLDITVPAPDDDEAQVVLEVDDTGLVRWHFAAGDAEQGPRDRGGSAQTFHIPLHQIEIDGDEAAGERGALGFGVRKVLHLLRFPVERAAGRVATFAAGQWEGRRRPYGLHRASPDYFAGKPDPAGPELFTGEPVLLLIHGTFSVGRSGFAGIGADAELLRTLSDRYGGRVVVFDHPSVHVDPDANVRHLLELLPPDRPAVVDVVAHSRGGLVARRLDAARLAAAAGRPAPVVRRLIHVATPNAGTTLASSEHLGDLLDVFTNLVTLFTDEGSGTIASGVLEVVKQMATGALGGLAGLAAMDPAAQSLAELNAAGTDGATRVAAITSNFDSAGAKLAVRALDAVVDRLLADDNDLVVPTGGVYRAGSYVVGDCLDLSGQAPSIAHSGFLGDAGVRRWLADRLPGN